MEVIQGTEDVIGIPNGNIRQFNTGATRDTNEGKFDYEGFYSPLVMERFAKYMHKHRKQADGELRDSDNWQKGFGEDHFAVCMKSGHRHFMDWWKQHRGYKGQDALEDSLCALLFNVMAYLFKILNDKEKNKFGIKNKTDRAMLVSK